MSIVIDFLEKMGQDASLRHASSIDVETETSRAQLDPEIKAAIIAADQQRIEALLGGNNRCCMLAPGKEEEDDEEESPSRDGEEAGLRAPINAAA